MLEDKRKNLDVLNISKIDNKIDYDDDYDDDMLCYVYVCVLFLCIQFVKCYDEETQR
jgi:hypothetical protein